MSLTLPHCLGLALPVAPGLQRACAGSAGLAPGAVLTFSAEIPDPGSPPAWVACERLSAAAYRSPAGLLVEAGTNTLRLHAVGAGCGLLSEATMSNLVWQSDDFSGAHWGKYSGAAAALDRIGPDGVGGGAWTIGEENAGGNGYLYQAKAAFSGGETAWLTGLVARDAIPKSTRWPMITFNMIGGSGSRGGKILIDTQGGDFATYTVANAPHPSGAFVEALNDSWWRIGIEVEDTAGDNVNAQIQIFPAINAGATFSYATSAATQGEIGLTRLQVEVDGPSSPIVTGAGAGVRAADVITIDCTHPALGVPDGDALRFTDTNGQTADAPVSGGAAIVPHSSWAAPWATMERLAA